MFVCLFNDNYDPFNHTHALSLSVCRLSLAHAVALSVGGVFARSLTRSSELVDKTKNSHNNGTPPCLCSQCSLRVDAHSLTLPCSLCACIKVVSGWLLPLCVSLCECEHAYSHHFSACFTVSLSSFLPYLHTCKHTSPLVSQHKHSFAFVPQPLSLFALAQLPPSEGRLTAE